MQSECSSGLGRRIALVGPTASGKTAVGIHLAQRWNAEIISADSMQVYRLMDIGTAKPTPDEQKEAVFHAIDVVDPDQEWTLADYQRLGESAFQEIATRGLVPLLVGGTGLYIRALTTRLDIPSAPPDEEFRRRWREFANTNGNASLLAEVARVDPKTADRLHVNDIGRQIRALEVWEATGQTLTELHAENQSRQSRDESLLLFGLHFEDREILYRRIECRVDEMLRAGLLDEVRGLLENGYVSSLKPMLSLGYRHMLEFLAGRWDWDKAVAEMKQDTRRFAKRQMIWFRGDRRIHWVSADEKSAEQLAEEICEAVESYGDAKKDSMIL